MAKIVSRTACLGLVALMHVHEARAVSDPHGILGTPQAPAAQEPEDDSSRMSVAELRHTLPDLKLRDSLPGALFALQAGMHIPYQVLGVGLGVDLYPRR